MKRLHLAVRSFRQFGLRDKDITYLWDQPANQKTKKFYTEGELGQKQKNIMTRKMKEDFRIHLLDLKKVKAVEKPVEDEIFGFDLPDMKKFDTSSTQEIYRTEKSPDSEEFIANKLSYLPEYVHPFGKIDARVEQAISEIKGLVHNKEVEFGNIRDEYLLRESIFKNQDIKEAMLNLKSAISEINYKYIPVLISKLCFDLKYNEEYTHEVGLYRTIEEKINSHIHLYSITELAQIYFGLTFKLPKKCSLALRQLIREKIANNNFNVLSPEQVMRIYTAFKNDFNSQKIHHKCIEYFFDQKGKVEKCLAQDPNLAIKVLYTYMNSRPTNRYRRALLEDQEIEKEADKMTDWYMPLVLQSISQMKKNDFLRLLSVVYTLKLKDYEELYIVLEDYFLNNIDGFNNNEKALVLYYMARCNNDRGICTREFWRTIAKQHVGSTIPTNTLQITAFCRLLYSLTVTKSIGVAEFEKTFGQNILSFLSSEELSFSEASLLASVLVMLDSPTAKLDKYFKSFIKNVSLKQEWVPLRYYYQLKFFIQYCNTIHPEWNAKYIENLFYHAEKKFNTYHSRQSYVIPEYKDISSVISRLETYLLSFMDYKNLFLIDYCIEERKLAVMYLTDKDYLFDSLGGEKELNPLTEMKLRLLERDDFVVCSIDHEEFMAIRENKSEWLKKKLEEAYKLTEERAKEIHIAHQKKVMERILAFGKAEYEDTRFEDLKIKLEIVNEQADKLRQELVEANK